MKQACLFFSFLAFGLILKAQNNTDTLEHTLLWKITGHGMMAPSYLYGTMHTGDDRVFRLQDSALIVFDQVMAFAMEINVDSIDQQKMAQEMLLPEGQTLKGLLGDDDYKLASKYLIRSTGLPMFLLNRLKPIYIYSLLLEGKKSDQKYVLDVYYFKLAKKEKKTIIGLEKAEDQMALLNNIPLDKQVSILRETIHHFNEMKKELNEETNEYSGADLNKLQRETETDTTMGNNFMEDFLTKRNKVMANRMERVMKSGSTLFTAVGAAHLPGKQGIIHLLRNDGYTVSPVLSKTYLSPKEVRKKLK
jgi:uncharacterized protein